MSIDPQIAHDLWSYQDRASTATARLFDPGPEASADLIARRRNQRLGALMILEALVEDNVDQFVEGAELCVGALPAPAVEAKVLGQTDAPAVLQTSGRNFDVVTEQPPVDPPLSLAGIGGTEGDKGQ